MWGSQEEHYLSTVPDPQGLCSFVRDRKYFYKTLEDPDNYMQSGYYHWQVFTERSNEWELGSQEEVEMKVYECTVCVCVCGRGGANEY